MSVEPTKSIPLKNCRFCGNFSSAAIIKRIPFIEWVPGIRGSQCEYCKVIVKAFEEVHPEFLLGRCKNGPRPSESVSLGFDARGRVDLYIDPFASGRPIDDMFSVKVQIFYSLNESPSVPSQLSQIPILGEVSPVPGGDHMWSFIKRCRDDCLDKHERCRLHQTYGWVPKRLLHLSRHKDGTENLRLVQSKGLGNDVRYIALSHCWGKKLPVRTVHSNLHASMSHVSITDMPRTFQDCFTVARELDVTYVWIDSLCIIQDDEADWAEHAGTMDKVYENALFTVSAVSSDSGLVPFLGPEAPSKREKWQEVDLGQHGLPGIKVRNTGFYLHSDSIYGPLEFRAWTYQERHLSTRIVFFTEDEVHWQCKTSKTCECAGSFLGPFNGEVSYGSPREDMDAMHIWRLIVHEYSTRSLTYGTDRLPALSGVASRTSASVQSSYLAGMWRNDIHRQLAWHKGYSKRNHGSLDNGVPSWSWASVPGQATFLWEDQDILGYPNIAMRYAAKLHSLRCDPKAGNPFGEVKPGSYIKLRSQIIKADMESDVNGSNSAVITRAGMRPQIAYPDCRLVGQQNTIIKKWLGTHHSPGFHRRATSSECVGTGEEGLERTKAPVLCLLLFTAVEEFESSTPANEEYPCILILGKHDRKSNTYQRLGLACRYFPNQVEVVHQDRESKGLLEDWNEPGNWDDWKDWFAGAKTRTVKII